MEDKTQIDIKDLELMEERIAELEKYLGIDEIDPQHLYEREFEQIESKTEKLDKFIKLTEDKQDFIVELQEKYEQFVSYFRKDQSLSDYCLDQQKKTNIVMECGENLVSFISNLEELQRLEQYLNFEPIFDVNEKVQELKKLNIEHIQQLMDCQENSTEVETLVTTYNDIVQRLSAQMLQMEAQLGQKNS